ncbi:hypothetical protein [Streptomyces chiangmaiensis]|uniref:Uncharacterized protein n=1 Tax=Streptomyces chiangmaiensis TaxID=766497 RepID=A0ABU7FJL2_9ACTN|nr:hypothetical protein [Streptomyces chiangmaiensis]MED7824294.1 hypothetical protein [Streptomyces chiangmaiensis]
MYSGNEDIPIMDTVSHEQKTGMTPPYDQPSAIWTSLPRLTESSCKVPDYCPTGTVTVSEAVVADGDFATCADNKGVLSASYTLDPGRVRKVTLLGINQREWSPTYNRETFGRKQDSARLKDYTVPDSDEGNT